MNQKYDIAPTLLVGLGGTGRIALMEIKKILLENGYIDNEHDFPLIKFLAIDTEFLTSSDADKSKNKKEDQNPNKEKEREFIQKYYKNNNINFSSEEKVNLFEIKRNLKKYLKNPKTIDAADFIGSEENIKEVIKAAEGFGAGGYGLLGKVHLWKKLSKVYMLLKSQLNKLRDGNLIDNQITKYYSTRYHKLHKGQYTNIFVICSLGGGTGKGAVMTVGSIIKELLLSQSPLIEGSSLRHLVNFMPSCFTTTGRKVPESYKNTIKTNQYTSFKELEYVLNNAYPNEQKLIKIQGRDTDEHKTKEIFSHVLNVGKHNSVTHTNLGDYKTINRLVSETIVNFIYSGQFETALTGPYVSNKKANEAKIQEIEAPNAKRNCSYGRVGGYKFRYPVNELFDYAREYFVKEIFEDMVKGDLSESDEHDSDVGVNFSKQYIKNANNCYTQVQPPSYDPKNKFFDESIASDIKNKIKNNFSTLLHYLKPSNKEKLSKIEDDEFQIVEDTLYKVIDRERNIFPLIYYLEEYIKDEGLRFVNDVLNIIKSQFDSEIKERFNKELQQIEEEKLSHKLSFSIDSEESRKNLEKYLEDKQNKSLNDFKQKYVIENLNSGIYGQISDSCERDQNTWENKRGFWNKVGVKKEESKYISKNTKNIINNNIVQVEKEFSEIQKYAQKLSFFRTIQKYYKEIEDIKNIIEHNTKVLYNINSNGILKDCLIKNYLSKMDNILRTPVGDLEDWIIGQNETEFKKFALNLKLKKNKKVTDWVQEELNNNFMNRLVKEKVEANEFIDIVERKVNNIYELKNNYSICGYLSKLDDDNLQKDIINRLINKSSLLGEIDDSKISGGGADIGYKLKFISSDNPELINKILKLASKNDYISIKGENRDVIQISLIESSLPLCVFEELQDAKEKFEDYLSTGKQYTAKQKKFAKHTNKDFINLEEPIGNSNRIPDEDIPDFFNLLLHTRVVHFTEKGFVKILKKSTKVDKLEYLLDPKKSKKDYTPEQRRVTRDDFVKRFEKTNIWFIKFCDRLYERFRNIFSINIRKQRYASKEYIKKYFIFKEGDEKQFPYIPEVVMAYFKKKLDEDNSLPGSQFKNFISSKNLESYNKQKSTRMKKELSNVKICHDRHESRKYYSSPDWDYFHEEKQQLIYDLRIHPSQGSEIEQYDEINEDDLSSLLKKSEYYGQSRGGNQISIKRSMESNNSWTTINDFEDGKFFKKYLYSPPQKSKSEESKTKKYTIAWKEDGDTKKEKMKLEDAANKIIEIQEKDDDIPIKVSDKIDHIKKSDWEEYDSFPALEQKVEELIGGDDIEDPFESDIEDPF